jgi:hypothetical protein
MLENLELRAGQLLHLRNETYEYRLTATLEFLGMVLRLIERRMLTPTEASYASELALNLMHDLGLRDN